MRRFSFFRGGKRSHAITEHSAQSSSYTAQNRTQALQQPTNSDSTSGHPHARYIDLDDHGRKQYSRGWDDATKYFIETGQNQAQFTCPTLDEDFDLKHLFCKRGPGGYCSLLPKRLQDRLQNTLQSNTVLYSAALVPETDIGTEDRSQKGTWRVGSKIHIWTPASSKAELSQQCALEMLSLGLRSQDTGSDDGVTSLDIRTGQLARGIQEILDKNNERRFNVQYIKWGDMRLLDPHLPEEWRNSSSHT